jgi:periplasmic divalent cation tolerance protein
MLAVLKILSCANFSQRLYLSPKRINRAQMEFRSIYITTKDEAEARKIGLALVNERLAACVNYFPVKSVYRWREQVEEASEMALIAKTRSELVEDLIKRVKELHSYQTPCAVSWIIEKGNPPYLEWIRQSTERK